MSGIYVPGAFNKKKLTLEIPTVAHLEEKKIEQEPQKEPKTPKPAKEVISEIKPVEVKQTAWGGKKSFIECLKTASSEPELKPKEEAVIVKTNSMPVYVQKEIRKEEYDAFMQKYDTKLKKLYEKSIYYDKEYLSKLRINGEQGYLKFCKFMFSVI
jgi:hypothetical protein